MVRAQLVRNLDIGRGLLGGGIVHLDCGAVRVLQQRGGELQTSGVTGDGFIHLDCGALCTLQGEGSYDSQSPPAEKESKIGTPRRTGIYVPVRDPPPCVRLPA